MTFSFKLSKRLAQNFLVLGAAAALVGCAGESLTNPGNPSNPVSTITVSPVSADVAVDETLQLSAVLRDANGGSLSGLPVSWSTEDGSIATVTATGLVVGTDTGMTTITASSAGRFGSAVVRVRKKDALPPPPPPPSPPPGIASCLTQASPTITLTGARSPYDNGSMAANTGIDARTASWTGTSNYVVRYGGSGVCWSGGRITGQFPDGTSWSAYHDAYSMIIRGSPGTVIEGVRIHNYGDGPNFDAVGSENWTVRGNYMSYMHDDCISNDFGNSGLVDDNLMDGCYMGYSSRAYAGFVADNRAKVVRFQGNLIRLQNMPTGYTGPGHGKFWKMNSKDGSGSDPRLALHNNIFRMDTPPSCCGSFLIPPAAYLAECSNNIIVWLGPGEFPEPVPSCFTLTRDVSVWDNAVAEWKIRHPTVAAVPIVVAGGR